MPKQVLLITLEPVCHQMAGPAIRTVEIARQLATEFDVAVVSPLPTDFSALEQSNLGFKLSAGLSKDKVYKLASNYDILFVQANVLKTYPGLSKRKKYLVVDLYDPYLLAVLAQYKDNDFVASVSYRHMHGVLEKHMLEADFTVCASERQRDYWLGRFCALGRLTPELYQIDPSFGKLIDIVPFGLPGEPPVRTKSCIKGTIDGIKNDDQVLIWGGGIWEWFDPLVIIKAVAAIAKYNPRIKLFFMGWKSPNPQVPLMDMAQKARSLADSLGLTNQHVFFHEGWIPYESRANYLLDADIAVTAHFDLPETRLSFRTRVLDYLWCGLPILTTGGDQLADSIVAQQAGLALPFGDVDAWEKAINQLLNNPELAKKYESGSRNLARQFTWPTAITKLRDYCRNPYSLPKFKKLRKPTLAERTQSLWRRGGSDLIIQRIKDTLHDLIQR